MPHKLDQIKSEVLRYMSQKSTHTGGRVGSGQSGARGRGAASGRRKH